MMNQQGTIRQAGRSESMSEIATEERHIVVQQMKNRKSFGESNITTEMLKCRTYY